MISKDFIDLLYLQCIDKKIGEGWSDGFLIGLVHNYKLISINDLVDKLNQYSVKKIKLKPPRMIGL